MPVQLTKHRFTVEEYHQMAQTGILNEDDRVELIEGEIVVMSPINSRHAACVNRLNQLFTERLAGLAIVSVQNPIRLGEHSEPQPDLALLRPRADFYAQAHPLPPDVLLVIEVAETSAEADREVKIPLYARAGICEAWLVDLPGQAIEVYRQPAATGYAEQDRFRRRQSLTLARFPDLKLTVDKLLG